MIGARVWPFDKIQAQATDRKLKLSGQYGFFANSGNTEVAILEILAKFKPVGTHSFSNYLPI